MNIEKQLIDKDSILVGVFCLLASERLAEVYKKFSDKNLKDFNKFNEILQRAFYVTLDDKKGEINALKLALNKLIPDTEEYVDVLADQAQCSVISLAYALEYISEKDLSMASYVLQKVEESIDILSFEGKEVNKIITREVSWQNELLEKLTVLPELDLQSIQKLKEINRNYFIPSV